jgi:Cd2+/Zn2+-exporting ATPase
MNKKITNNQHRHGQNTKCDLNYDHEHNAGCDHDCKHEHNAKCDFDDNHNHGDGCDCGHNHEEGGQIVRTPFFVIGIILFILGLITEHFPTFFISALGTTAEMISWTSMGVLVIAYILVGKDVLKEAMENILSGKIFDENFLMAIASLGAFIIGEYPEAVGVMLFYNVGEYLQGRAIKQSKKSIAALMDIRPDVANLISGGAIKEVPAESIRVGDHIVVRPGEKVPLDGIIVDGSSTIDMRALTGESLPVDRTKDDEVLSGSVNGQSQLTIKVTKVFAESTASKIIDMVENAGNKKAKTENFITVFAKYYTPIVVGIAALIAVGPVILGFGSFSDWVYRGLVFLVVSCPCALVISIPLGFFGGIGGASAKGILVKGGNYLEALGKMDTIVFDKTGTLTTGEFMVRDIAAEPGFEPDDVLKYAAYAESSSTHPIGLSIVNKFFSQVGTEVDRSEVRDITEKAGHGVSVSAFGKKIIAGNERLMISEGLEVKVSDEIGTTVFISVDGKLAGYIRISDELKSDSKMAISQLKKRGVEKIVMLTGDTKKVAEKMGQALGITQVKSQLLPNQKVEAMEALIEEKEVLGADENKRGRVAFVGDGINDAPVLARADIGIAMGGVGSDAAIEAADIVIMNDEPSKIAVAIDIARKTKKIVWQNIVFALGVKVIVLILAALGFASMWAAVFADVGVALIATANSVRAGRIK